MKPSDGERNPLPSPAPSAAKAGACPPACPQPTESGPLDLQSALRGLADAGLPPKALAAAVEALLRAAKGVAAPVAGPRRVETA